MVSPDSGNRDRRSSDLTISNVKRILSVVSGDKCDLLSLLDRRLLRDVFLKQHCKEKNMHPKTIQKYLKNLEHFLSFILSENIEEFKSLKSNVESLKCKLGVWRQAYVKDSKIATMSSMERERKTKITPDDILEFEKSKIVCDTIAKLGQLEECHGKMKINRSFFTNVRDLLITEVFIDNEHRAGVLSNMNMEEYGDCEQLSEGSFCVTVFKHKQAKAGPIRVIFSPKLHSWLTLYVTLVRPVVTSDCSPSAKVFVTWNGQSFQYSGGISMASNALWKKAGMRGRCGANRLRKAAVSAVRDSAAGDEQIHKDLANLMGHTKATADRYYYMEERLQSAERAAEKLPVVMRTKSNKPPRPIRKVLATTSKKQHRMPSENIQMHATSAENEVCRSAFSPTKHKFTPEELSDLNNVFAEELDSNKISLNVVLRKQDMLKFTLTTRQIYDKLRQLCSTRNRRALDVPMETLSDKIQRMNNALLALPCSSESDEDFIPTSISLSSKANGKFTAKDVNILNSAFGSIIESGSCKGKEIDMLISTSHQAADFATRFSLATIKNRIKYEIRKMKSSV